MTTKTLSSLIVAGLLATSAAAAVQVIDPAVFAPGPASPAGSIRAKAANSGEALFLLRVSAIAGSEQRPAGIVRITR